ncbi:MAG TPA: hypothetical protein VGS19_26435 [Streptosporangiaceae bacterium]|nr:hypothetical protein [Streptosporangiaceae bacterium]
MALTDADQIRAALAENGARPQGRSRSARAEEIVAAAEAAGDPGLLVDALEHLINAYEYGAEHTKMPVPFTRVLYLLDTQPDCFSPRQLHNAFWYFKWVINPLMESPDVPLPAITGWVREMERRYRAAGFSMRTVAHQNLKLAQHIGDVAQAEASRLAMVSLPRDSKSDCAACEARELGQALILAGQDREALAAWAPVLTGRLRCLEEPHVTLAASLLPLLRTGETDEARSNHVRGYHLARGNANLAQTLGLHLEFCALTGNEGRGVEILAESWHLFTAVADPGPRLDFLTGAAVLLQRLTASGHGSITVHSATADSLLGQIMPEVTGLAARFDARNGTTWVGDEVNRRLRQPPLLGHLNLGMGAAALAVPMPVVEDTHEGLDDLDSLVRHARELGKAGHPGARQAWERVKVLVAGTDIDDALAGELVEDQAFALCDRANWQGALSSLRDAAAHFRAAGLPGREAAAAARAEWAAAEYDPGYQPWPGLDTQLANAERLLAAGQADPRDLLTVRQVRALVAASAWRNAAGAAREELAEQCSAETAGLIADARAHHVPAREGMGEALLAASAAQAGDEDGETTHLQAALRLFGQADRPWMTPPFKARLAELTLYRGDRAAATSLLEDAIATATAWPAAEFALGPVYLLLAHICRLNGQPDLAVSNTRIGLSLFSKAGDALGAARARADLGLALGVSGRLDEAATMLTDAIAQLDELSADGATASVRVTLGQVLRESGDHRGAATQFALAADAYGAGDDQAAYLSATAEAALSLADSGMWDESTRAYQQAVTLATTLGQWQRLVIMHRQLAQISVRDGQADGPGRAVSHIQDALAAGEQAYAAATPAGTAQAGPVSLDREVARERGITCHEAARALSHAECYEQALAWLERGIADLTTDDAHIDHLTHATYLAASIQGSKLGQTEQAQQRLQGVIERCTQLGRKDCAAPLARLAAEFEPAAP